MEWFREFLINGYTLDVKGHPVTTSVLVVFLVTGGILQWAT